MNTRTIIPVVAFLLPALLVLAVPVRDDGWTDLFDGRSLDGWEGDRALWRVEGGAIVGQGPEGGPVPRTAYLFHELEATDLVLEVPLREPGRGPLRTILGWSVRGQLVVRPGRDARIVAL